MKKSRLVIILACVVLLVFLGLSCKVIDKGTEGRYTGVVAFDASADSGNDWASIVSELTEKAQDLSALDLSALGDGKAVSLKGTVSEFVSKANGKKNSFVVAPEGFGGSEKVTVQIGSIYSGTAVRDCQTLKIFGDFTNQTEWSQYAKALNLELHTQVVEPLNIDESIQGKTVTIVGAATASGSEVTITPVSIVIE